jgi:hypothetical protein
MSKLKEKYNFVKQWRFNNPERVKAQRLVFSALRNKTLERKPCEICGCEKVEAHHEDYSKPLEINWLCKPHHVEADKARRLREKISTV